MTIKAISPIRSANTGVCNYNPAGMVVNHSESDYREFSVELANAMKASAAMNISFAGASKNGKQSGQYVQFMSELAPFTSTGGLGVVTKDFAQVFPGRNVFFLPYYNKKQSGVFQTEGGKPFNVEEKPIAKTTIFWVDKNGVGQDVPVELYKVKRDSIDTAYKGKASKNLEVYLVSTPLIDSMQKEYYVNPELSEKDRKIAMRQQYAQFTKAAVALLPKLCDKEEGLNPEGFLGHDWHTTFAVKYMQDPEYKDFYKGTKIGYIIHNLGAGYQGRIDEKQFGYLISTKSKDGQIEIDDALTKKCSLGQGGPCTPWRFVIDLADEERATLSAVSPGTAKELTKKEYASGLENDMQRLLNSGYMKGIVNGLTTADARPDKTDSWVFVPKFLQGKYKTFGAGDKPADIIKAKGENKKALLDALSDPNIKPEDIFRAGGTIYGNISKKHAEDYQKTPVFFSWSRFVDQKGVYMAIKAAKQYAAAGNPGVFVFGAELSKAQVDLDGKPFKDGDNKEVILKTQINKLINDEHLKGRIVFLDGWLPINGICAGADYSLFTSKFEPCGLTQLEAMQFGCIPIVSNTGGFASTVAEGKTGFLTETDYLTLSPNAVRRDKNFTNQIYKAMKNAYATYLNPDKRGKMAKQCLNKKVGWDENGEGGESSSMQQLLDLHFRESKSAIC